MEVFFLAIALVLLSLFAIAVQFLSSYFIFTEVFGLTVKSWGSTCSSWA